MEYNYSPSFEDVEEDNEEVEIDDMPKEQVEILDSTTLDNSERWSKDAKNRIIDEVQESGSAGRSGSGYVSEMVYVNQTMRSLYDLAQLSKSHQEARSMLTGILDDARQQISTLVKNLNVVDPCDDLAVDEDDDQMNGVQIRDPLTAKSRGTSNPQIICHWDNKSKKGKGKGKGREKAESSNTKSSKRKTQSSQEGTNSQGANYMPPPQYPTFRPAQHPAFPPPQHPAFPPQSYPFQPPLFVPQFNANQSHLQYPNQGFDANQSQLRYPNQGGGSGNIYLGGQMNLFGYTFETPRLSQEHSDNN